MSGNFTKAIIDLEFCMNKKSKHINYKASQIYNANDLIILVIKSTDMLSTNRNHSLV